MGKRSVKDVDMHVVRTTKSSLKSIESNRTKGLFYYEDDGKYVLIDNRAGKMVIYKYDTLLQLTEQVL